ncbi:hypothetical protein Z043_116355 [Scleropages formosus]|uniref:SUZ domain-containing protein n=1 Tax=Scleropages formosus TaxID=113540 RepID=A0A0P7TV77_SCLFO|nr:hypothetical protein Z043_116355 [Scleropages formosus]
MRGNRDSRRNVCRANRDGSSRASGSRQSSTETDSRWSEPRPWSSTDSDSSSRNYRPAVTKTASIGGITVLTRGDSGASSRGSGKLCKTGSESSSSGGSSGSLSRVHLSLQGPTLVPTAPPTSCGSVSFPESQGPPSSPSYILVSLDGAGIPPGSILLNPHTGQPFVNPDGSPAIYNPPNGQQSARGQQQSAQQSQQPQQQAPPQPLQPQQPMASHMVPQVNPQAVNEPGGPRERQVPEGHRDGRGAGKDDSRAAMRLCPDSRGRSLLTVCQALQPSSQAVPYSAISYPSQHLLPVAPNQPFAMRDDLPAQFGQLSLSRQPSGEASESSSAASVFPPGLLQQPPQQPGFVMASPSQQLPPGGFASSGPGSVLSQPALQSSAGFGQQAPSQVPMYYYSSGHYPTSTSTQYRTTPVQYSTHRNQQIPQNGPQQTGAWNCFYGIEST